MIGRLLERWHMRGRSAELARWNAGHHLGLRASPIPKSLLASYKPSDIDSSLDLHARANELFGWNRYESKEDRRWRELVNSD